MKYRVLSIVFPGGSKIAKGEKTLEVRSWLPPEDFDGDLLIVENHKYLKAEGDSDPDGTAVAIVKIKNVKQYIESDIPAACASRWEPGYFSWEIYDVRPLNHAEKVLAARGIYQVELDLISTN